MARPSWSTATRSRSATRSSASRLPSASRVGVEMTLRITDQAYATDTGRQRSANEDSVFVRAPIFVIADGMGGAQAGEVASKTSSDSSDRELPTGPPERVLKQTIEGANRTIHKLARQDPNLAG